jgi:hypothetical protein
VLIPEIVKSLRLTLPFTARIDQAANPVTVKLLQLMASKQSNLCVAADVTSTSDLISLAESMGPYVCVFKTHIDIVEDFSPQLIQDLLAVAQKHNFLLMEDRYVLRLGERLGVSDLEITKVKPLLRQLPIQEFCHHMVDVGWFFCTSKNNIWLNF